MIIMKFGGTSVADAKAMRRVADIVRSRQNKQPAVVVSAVGGLTNKLVALAKSAVAGEMENIHPIIDEIKRRHLTIIRDLELDNYAALETKINDTMDQLATVCQKMADAGMAVKKLTDELLSVGEYMSANILAAHLDTIGLNGIMIDSRDILLTDSNFGTAQPQFDASAVKANEILVPLLKDGKIPVMQGFIGRDASGATTTLGRGGSDYSASLFGAMIGVQEVEIWSDVSGVLTADPSLIPEAKRILHMTFEEAAELAYFGAKVLHPATMLPAVDKDIPIHVLNSMQPQQGGTRIAPKSLIEDEQCIIKSIAYKEGLTVISVDSTRMLMAHGFMASIFAIFEKYQTSVDLVATSEVSVSMTVDNTEHMDDIENELKRFADIKVEPEKAIVCLVGENMKQTLGMPGKIFGLLQDVHIHLISQGASEINISFVVDESQLEFVIATLHEHFFGSNYDTRIFCENN